MNVPHQWYPCMMMLLLSLALAAWAEEGSPEFKRTMSVPYSLEEGRHLLLDVFQPADSNRAGIIFVASGNFKSGRSKIHLPLILPLLKRGYTVFAVCHSGAPHATVSDIVQQMHRSVRFIRYHADRYGIDPRRLGATGASSGGYLSLMLATQGGIGPLDPRDPVDQAPSTIQAVACFFPPTDLLNYGAPSVDGVGVGLLEKLGDVFGPAAATPEGRQALGREISPIYHISSLTPPVLILHGDDDRVVPIQQAHTFLQRCRDNGIPAELVIRAGRRHGWDREEDMPLLADWFDRYLLGTEPKRAP